MIQPEDHSLEPDPIETETVEFDWQSLYLALGEPTTDGSEQYYAALGTALGEIVQFLIEGEPASRKYKEEVARRTISLAWVLRPGLFDGNPSLTKLAKALGLNAPAMSAHTVAVFRKFGIVNSAQSHGWNRK